MDALDLLSGDEDDEPQDETSEPHVENQIGQLDFEALKKAGYSSADDAVAADDALQSAFSSLAQASATQSAPSLGKEIPGYKTTFTILKEGDPQRVVAKGCKVIVHAVGIIGKFGKVFWTTKEDPRGPHLFIAGAGKKVVGWEQGCLGMCIAEVRKLQVPSCEAYGAQGLAQWGIPPYTDLEFTIECLDIAAASAEELLQYVGSDTKRKDSKAEQSDDSREKSLDQPQHSDECSELVGSAYQGSRTDLDWNTEDQPEGDKRLQKAMGGDFCRRCGKKLCHCVDYSTTAKRRR